MATTVTKSKLGIAFVAAEILGTLVFASGFMLNDTKKSSTRKKIGAALFFGGWIGGIIARRKK